MNSYDDCSTRKSPAPPSYESIMGDAAHLERPPPTNPYFPTTDPVPVSYQPLPAGAPHPAMAYNYQHPGPYNQQVYEPPVAATHITASGPTRLPVGPDPIRSNCPVCHKRIKSVTRTKNKYSKHVCCFILLSTVVCAVCSCLPYFFCPPMEVTHTCPECNAFLGKYRETSC